MGQRKRVFAGTILASIMLAATVSGCQENDNNGTPSVAPVVPHEAQWGIYELNLETQAVSLVYSTPDEIFASTLRLNAAGDRFVFAQKAAGAGDEGMEIYVIGIDGESLTRLTNNGFMDLYPIWSPDGSQIAFLSKRDQDLDIYVMAADGTGVRKLYDSGDNDADIDWVGESIVFTCQSAIWRMNEDGTQPVQISHPPQQGQWGEANLPAGDYDPRLSPDGTKVVFERLVDTGQPNGAYDIFIMSPEGTGETRLTHNGYAQGLANWSRSGDRLVYAVAAINGEGKFDIYMMNADGTDNRNLTPDYFPATFLCHSPVFAQDDSAVFFIGQWWR